MAARKSALSYLTSKGINFDELPEYSGPAFYPTNGIMLALNTVSGKVSITRRMALILMGHKDFQHDDDLIALGALQNAIQTVQQNRDRAHKAPERQELMEMKFRFPKEVPLGNDFFEKMPPVQETEAVKALRLTRKRELYYRRGQNKAVEKVECFRRKFRNECQTTAALRRSLELWKARNNIVRGELIRSRQMCKWLEEKVRRLKEKKNTIGMLKNELTDAQVSFAEFQNEIINLKDQNRYSAETQVCIAKLKQCGVADSKVGEVMEAVGALVSKKFASVPCRGTVQNASFFQRELAKEQLKNFLEECLERDESFTLMSDETTKRRHKLQTFTLSASSDRNKCLILGTTEVVDKSAEVQLGALKCILQNLCDDSELLKKSVCGVTCLMSDGAATEAKFNQLFMDWRASILPTVKENWHQMSEVERNKFLKVNVFLCHLHVISNLTAKCFDALAVQETVEKGHVVSAESSGVKRLINDMSRYFGERASGHHQAFYVNWLTYANEKGLQGFKLPSFLGHRFNIAFTIAAHAYDMKEDIMQFLEKFGFSKSEGFKSISEGLRDPLMLAQLKVLALIDQLITGPLWRLLEGSAHVLQAAVWSKVLLSWLEKCERNHEVFLSGETPPFALPNEDQRGKHILEKLITDDLQNVYLDNALAAVLRSCVLHFEATLKPFLHGDYAEMTSELMKDSASCPSTNSSCEASFSIIDRTFSTAPNMTIHRREIYSLLVKNRPLEWLESLSVDKRDAVLEQCLRSRNDCLKTIRQESEKLIAEQKAKLCMQAQKVAREQARIRKAKERYTETICKNGFWKSALEMDAALKVMAGVGEREAALRAQIRFRQKTLAQPPPEPSFYKLSVKRTQLNEVVLREKLAVLMNSTDTFVDEESEFIGRIFLHTFECDGKEQAYRGRVKRALRANRNAPLVFELEYEGFDKVYAFDEEQFLEDIEFGLLVFDA